MCAHTFVLCLVDEALKPTDVACMPSEQQRGPPGLFLHPPSALRPHRDPDADVCDHNKMPRPPSACRRVRPTADKKNKNK